VYVNVEVVKSENEEAAAVEQALRCTIATNGFPFPFHLNLKIGCLY